MVTVRKDKIKVLVVDDSLLFRQLLTRSLAADPQIEVVATAADPFEARDKIMAYDPDVMTLDVEMPKMNGIEFLRRLMPQYPLPTVMISSVSDAVFEAIQLGAVDFICKPTASAMGQADTFFRELRFKVKIAAQARIQKIAVPSTPKNLFATNPPLNQQDSRIIAMGASTGGTVALTTVLAALKPSLPGIVIVQHIPPVFSTMFAKRLDASTAFEVKEAADGDAVWPGRVLIAPGDRHMRLRRKGNAYCVECFAGETVNGHCPAVDVLFDSVASFGSNAIGVIMTGMGQDGARGLLKMRRAGAKTIGQDEASSVVYGMPKVAYGIGAVQVQVPLERIASKICEMI